MSAEVIENPNDKALVVEVPITEHFESISRVVIMRPASGFLGKAKYNVADESPLADKLFQQFKGLIRLDIAREGDHLLFTGVGKHVIWGTKAKEDFTKAVVDSADNLVNVDKVKSSFNRVDYYVPDDDVKTEIKATFDNEVKKSLDEHGGSIEVLNVEIYEDDSVDVQILLMGSCADCGSAVTQTLKGAENGIIATINVLKEKYSNLDNLHFDELVTTSVNRGIWMPRKVL